MNFNEANRPQKDGAWLIRNSWGKNWGDGGYFWMSYEDKSFTETTAYIAENADNYDHNYGYDDLGWCGAAGYGETAWMGNIFRAGRNETCSAVAFYTTANNADYEIFVYTNLSDPSNPTSGVLQTSQKGTELYAGYHTIPLEKATPLKKGGAFSVVVKMTTPGYTYPLALEAALEGYSDNAKANPGESFLSPDGKTWEDVGEENNMNACVKAFTIDRAVRSPGGGCNTGAFGFLGGGAGILILVTALTAARTTRKNAFKKP